MTEEERRNAISGLDCIFFAVDADGHVGFFSTFGVTAVPDAAIERINVHEAALVSLLGTSATTTPLYAKEVGEEGVGAIERGFYAFDPPYPTSDFYNRVGVPAQPRLLTELPEPIGAVVRTVVLANLRFADSAVITAAQLLTPPTAG